MLLSAVPEARFPRAHRAESGVTGHVAGDHVSKPRERDDLRHTERHGGASWLGFLEGHGFEDVTDYRDLACPEMLSSWGVEDRCMVDKVVDLIAGAGTQPFFVHGWTTQTHHPYETSPGLPLHKFGCGVGPDDWELGPGTSNVVHETGSPSRTHLRGGASRAGSEQDTLIVVKQAITVRRLDIHTTPMLRGALYEEDVTCR